MWLFIYIISTGNCRFLPASKPTKPTMRFTFHIISHVEFEILSTQSAVGCNLGRLLPEMSFCRAERPLQSLASTSAFAASSTRQISARPMCDAPCSAVSPAPSVAATAPGTVRRRWRTAPRWPLMPAKTMSLLPRRGTGRPGRAPVAGPQRPQGRPKILYKN